jgi:hypothetical protein
VKSNQKSETIRHYLLGQVTPEGSSQIEEQLITDDAFFQALLVAEDELVDEYLGHRLSPAELQSFETLFLVAPERQKKLRFARALHKYVELSETPEVVTDSVTDGLSRESSAAAKPAPKSGLFSFLPFSNPIVARSFAAAMLLIVAGVSWVVFNNWRQQTPSEPGAVYVVALAPGLTRDGGEIQKVNLSAAIDTVELRLALPQSDYQIYRSVVLTDSQSEVWASADLAAATDAGESFVVSRVPAKLLVVGDYRMKLRGRASNGSFEDVASYQFRVTR